MMYVEQIHVGSWLDSPMDVLMAVETSHSRLVLLTLVDEKQHKRLLLVFSIF